MATILERLAGRLSLPAEVVAGSPRVTLTGTERALVENHRGLLDFTDSEVRVAGRAVTVRIRGDGLLLQAMDGEMLLVAGHIICVELE